MAGQFIEGHGGVTSQGSLGESYQLIHYKLS
jgi:hypothetical protein